MWTLYSRIHFTVSVGLPLALLLDASLSMNCEMMGCQDMNRQIKKVIKNLIPNRILSYRLPCRSGKSAILLTFDDGPDKIFTPLILETLDKYDAKAIFFVVGYKAKRSPRLVKMIADRGHIVGNHSYSHPNISLPPFKTYKADLIRCQKVLYQLTGKMPHLFRPPRGVVSFSGLLISERLSLRNVLWSVEGGEWSFAKSDSANTIGERLKMILKPRDILLLHDNNRKIPEVLDILLPWCKSQNIDLKTAVDAISLCEDKK